MLLQKLFVVKNLFEIENLEGQGLLYLSCGIHDKVRKAFAWPFSEA